MDNFLIKNLIAHRGIHDGRVKENTLTAFKRARDKEYIIELDLRLSKDNQIVVYHDDNLKRLFNVDIAISDINYDIIKNYKFDNGDGIPLFKDVLKMISGKVPFLIEIKKFDKNEILLDMLMDLLNKYKGEYAIQSFDYKIIKTLKKKYPNVLRGLLLEDVKNYYTKMRCRPHFLACKKSIINNNKIQRYRIKHSVLVWTIRNKKDYEFARNYADNYICEYFGGKDD